MRRCGPPRKAAFATALMPLQHLHMSQPLPPPKPLI